MQFPPARATRLTLLPAPEPAPEPIPEPAREPRAPWRPGRHPAWPAIPAWHAALPEGARGRWCLLRVSGMPPGSALRLRLVDEARGHTVRELFLARPTSAAPALRALLHVPAEARALALDGFGPGAPRDALLSVLPRVEAAARLLAAGLARLPAVLPGSPLGLAGRLRATLGRAGAGERPDYAAWIARHDRWGDEDRADLLAAARHAPPIHAVVLGRDGPARAATLRALDGQWRPADTVTVPDAAQAGTTQRGAAQAGAAQAGIAQAGATQAGIAQTGIAQTGIAQRGAAPGGAAGPLAAAGAQGGYVAILGAGEVPAPHALALVAAHLAAWIVDADAPDIVHADEDRLREDGARDAPLFHAEAGEALLLSGLLTRGLVLARAALLSPDADASRASAPDASAPDSSTPRVASHAEAVRLRLWLRAGPEARARHLPFVLTHRRADAEAATPELAEVVQAHLGPRGTVAAAHPLRIRRHPTHQAGISVIVPSACRGAHVPRCLARLLAGTAHPIREVLVAVSRIDPDDRRQRRVLRQLAALEGVRVLDLGLPEFSYARVNNLAAAEARGDTLLLLNDDVAPLRPARRGTQAGRDPSGPADPRLWLSTMAAHLEDPGVGAVGARLLYGDGRVQHGGVVLGLGGLAEHADRLRARRDPGPHGLALIDREMSAATAACLLLRRSTWEALGGMDERFAVALNDVDLCLRLRGLGLGVRQANTAELTHYESLSLGRHYAGARAALEALEVRLLRALHAPALADDPFHSQNLSLELGAEDQPAFPPRMRAELGEAGKARALPWTRPMPEGAGRAAPGPGLT